MKKVLLLLANGFEMYEASVFIDVIGWNYSIGDKSTRLFTCGNTATVKTSFDQRLTVDYSVDEIDAADFDALAVPGGFEAYGFYEDAYSESFSRLIREFDRQGKPIASVCVAALALGKAGILENRPATTYKNETPAKRIGQLREFGAEICEDSIAVDGNVITSCDPSTAIPVAFLLLEKLTSERQANYIKRIMGFR